VEDLNIDDLLKKIIDHLKVSKGSSPLTDKTPPQQIYSLFGVSKKKFKIAIGMLYKKKLITIDDQGIKLVKA
jgi:predicted RNA-binding protein (virulence factor B family)